MALAWSGPYGINRTARSSPRYGTMLGSPEELEEALVQHQRPRKCTHMPVWGHTMDNILQKGLCSGAFPQTNDWPDAPRPRLAADPLGHSAGGDLAVGHTRGLGGALLLHPGLPWVCLGDRLRGKPMKGSIGEVCTLGLESEWGRPNLGRPRPRRARRWTMR